MFAVQGEINASVINVLQDKTTYYVKQERVSGRSRPVFLSAHLTEHENSCCNVTPRHASKVRTKEEIYSCLDKACVLKRKSDSEGSNPHHSIRISPRLVCFLLWSSNLHANNEWNKEVLIGTSNLRQLENCEGCLSLCQINQSDTFGMKTWKNIFKSNRSNGKGMAFTIFHSFPQSPT